jgi:hypothetical protein
VNKKKEKIQEANVIGKECSINNDNILDGELMAEIYCLEQQGPDLGHCT